MQEITAEYAAQELAPAPELKIRPRVTVACKTDLGRVRENNEDKFEYYLPEDEPILAGKGLVFVVCDGMGGHEAGQIASEMACKTFLFEYLQHPSQDPLVALSTAVRAANRLVLDCSRAIPSRRGMGTTLSALAVIQDAAWIAHVGDSRIYRLRLPSASQSESLPSDLGPRTSDLGPPFLQLTKDHTWVEDAVASGMFTREEAERHQYRHVLTRAIGTEDDVIVDVERFNVQEGDVYLLCSDGVMNHVSDSRLEEVLSSSGPSEACWQIVSDALVGGGSDNTTVMIVRVDGLESIGD
ncbi:MAG: serine/threonine-protein phosphatase [Armatimonadetes bacterium]|nr:serine/threonine-protein phosphatase [Armatimonadota bacterium]